MTAKTVNSNIWSLLKWSSTFHLIIYDTDKDKSVYIFVWNKKQFCDKTTYKWLWNENILRIYNDF